MGYKDEWRDIEGGILKVRQDLACSLRLEADGTHTLYLTYVTRIRAIEADTAAYTGVYCEGKWCVLNHAAGLRPALPLRVVAGLESWVNGEGREILYTSHCEECPQGFFRVHTFTLVGLQRIENVDGYVRNRLLRVKNGWDMV